MARFEVPGSWTVQAFMFALDCTPQQAACLRRQFGGRRYARNWAVRSLKEDLDRYRQTGRETEKPSLASLRKRWNQAKDTECLDRESGEAWWPQVSKEAFADGIKAAVDGYWNENTRRLQRLLAKGRARVLAVTVSRKGTRLIPAFRVLVQRPQQPGPASPGSRVGVDVGVRVLATVAAADGTVLERVPNPRPLEAALKELRHLCRERSRRTWGSPRCAQAQQKITRLQRRVADIRGHHIHVLTARLAKTHGEIVVEGLDAAGMLRQKGLPGARARRRGLADSALGAPRRQLAYKTAWYGSRIVIADRWYPSSKTCHICHHVQDIGRAERWSCGGCGAVHQRDDNAAVNLARYELPIAGDSAVGSVGAAVKRRADRKTGPRPAGGAEARKGRSRTAAEQPRDGVPA